MRLFKITLLVLLCTAPFALLTGAGQGQKQTPADPVARGKYLVNFGG